MSRLRAGLYRYRWEIWLVLGLPLAAGIIETASGNAYSLLWLYTPWEDAYRELPVAARTAAWMVHELPSLAAHLALLVWTLRRTRKLGRPWLTLIALYGVYAVAAGAVLNVAAEPVRAAMFEMLIGPDAGLWLAATSMGNTLLMLGMRTWIAREATRVSFTHGLAVLAAVTAPRNIPLLSDTTLARWLGGYGDEVVVRIGVQPAPWLLYCALLLTAIMAAAGALVACGRGRGTGTVLPLALTAMLAMTIAMPVRLLSYQPDLATLAPWVLELLPWSTVASGLPLLALLWFVRARRTRARAGAAMKEEA